MKHSNSRRVNLFKEPPDGQLGWIYCGDNNRMPPPLTPVTVLAKSPGSDEYTPIEGCYWKTSLADFDINYDKEPIWYAWENRLTLNVIAWLYINPRITLTAKEIENFTKTGVIIYGYQ